MSLQAFNKLISLLSPLLKRNDSYSQAHQVQSHQLSMLELGSSPLQEASCPTSDMFLEYPLQRPATASSASLTPFYVVIP